MHDSTIAPVSSSSSATASHPTFYIARVTGLTDQSFPNAVRSMVLTTGALFFGIACWCLLIHFVQVYRKTIVAVLMVFTIGMYRVLTGYQKPHQVDTVDNQTQTTREKRWRRVRRVKKTGEIAMHA